MRVFLSSTYRDLVEYRKKAAQAVELLGQQAGRMEVFGAQPREPKQACLREVEQSDSFVGIYAYRYGFIPEGSKISITEMELQHALKQNKPVFCFIVDERYAWPKRLMEEPPGSRKLERLKRELRDRYTCTSFTTEEDLGMKVAASLGRYGNEISGPVYAISGMVKAMSGGNEEERRKARSVLQSASLIANKTLQYISKMNRGVRRDYREEAALSEGWTKVGTGLLELKDPPRQLARRFFHKGQYWSSPENWSEEWIRASEIGLEEITADAQELLLSRATEDSEAKPPARKPRAHKVAKKGRAQRA